MPGRHLPYRNLHEAQLPLHIVTTDFVSGESVVLSAGQACAVASPPVGAVANALHALTLLTARQLVAELEALAPDIEYVVVPPLCPMVGSPYDFSRTGEHIDRAIES